MYSAINSPKILELSGIGSPEVLKPLGIPVKVDLPSVGEGVVDQIYTGLSYGEHKQTGLAPLNADAPGYQTV